MRGTRVSPILWAIVLGMTGAQIAEAQAPVRAAEWRSARALSVNVQDAEPKSGFSAFAIEALGATAGSAAGFALIYLSSKDECDVEDLGCNLENAATAIGVGTAGAAIGDYLAGKLGNTRPSGVGAVIGAVVGAAAGLGTWHLFTEELDIVNKSEAATAVYVVTQGVVTALGSRIVRALK